MTALERGRIQSQVPINRLRSGASLRRGSFRQCDDFLNSSKYWRFCSQGLSEFGKVQLPQHAKPGGAGVLGLPTVRNSAMRTP